MKEFLYTLEDRMKKDFKIPVDAFPTLNVEAINAIEHDKNIVIEGPYPLSFARKIAKGMVHDALAIQKGEIVVIGSNPGAESVVAEVVKELQGLECEIRILWMDNKAESQITQSEIATAYMDARIALFENATKYIGIRYDTDPADPYQLHPECKKIFQKKSKRLRELAVNYPEQLLRCITLLPTEWQAKNDGYAFEEYVALYEAALDQPWGDVHDAQEAFIENVLNPGKSVVIQIDAVNPDDDSTATDISMSIDGMQFANSGIKRNFPGSEMFSAPERESLAGHVYFHGNFTYESKAMKNIRIRFENGKIVDASAEVGDDSFQEIISRPGANYIGELGIGTNPGLQDALFSNGLLVEKVGGTFHLALGQAYEIKEYDGKPIHMDNGNDSDVHWDITCVNNIGHNSRMYVDGVLVRYNGFFLGEKYAAINPKLKSLALTDVPNQYHQIS